MIDFEKIVLDATDAFALGLVEKGFLKHQGDVGKAAAESINDAAQTLRVCQDLIRKSLELYHCELMKILTAPVSMPLPPK